MKGVPASVAAELPASLGQAFRRSVPDQVKLVKPILRHTGPIADGAIDSLGRGSRIQYAHTQRNPEEQMPWLPGCFPASDQLIVSWSIPASGNPLRASAPRLLPRVVLPASGGRRPECSSRWR